ncbi:hypothetical protein [Streptococcus parasuis]|uniref:hypothetical protein n=1 Tax=Streptococcus parasuis TaxID=1501662 RepID=UPI002FE2F8F8
MSTAKLLKKNTFVMRMHQATAEHPENGEKIDISISGCLPVITYKGRMVTWDVQELINEAIELIESEEN